MYCYSLSSKSNYFFIKHNQNKLVVGSVEQKIHFIFTDLYSHILVLYGTRDANVQMILSGKSHTTVQMLTRVIIRLELHRPTRQFHLPELLKSMVENYW